MARFGGSLAAPFRIDSRDNCVMEVFGLALLPHDIAYAISRHPKKVGHSRESRSPAPTLPLASWLTARGRYRL